MTILWTIDFFTSSFAGMAMLIEMRISGSKRLIEQR